MNVYFSDIAPKTRYLTESFGSIGECDINQKKYSNLIILPDKSSNFMGNSSWSNNLIFLAEQTSCVIGSFYSTKYNFVVKF